MQLLYTIRYPSSMFQPLLGKTAAMHLATDGYTAINLYISVHRDKILPPKLLIHVGGSSLGRTAAIHYAPDNMVFAQ